MKKQKILAIIGSTRAKSSNLSLINVVSAATSELFDLEIFDGIDKLSHFNPDLDNERLPAEILDFRNQIEAVDAVLFCTPEYVFSIPGSLKNALEWCVSTTIFTQKVIGLITASASGLKGKEELEMIMNTLGATFTQETSILISGVKGKFDKEGNLVDKETIHKLDRFVEAFCQSFLNQDVLKQ